MNTFTRAASALLVAFSLAGCLGSGQTPAMRQAAFCNSVSGTIEKMALLNAAGALSQGEVAAVDTLITASTPYCTSGIVAEPGAALLAALDRVLILQLSKG